MKDILIHPGYGNTIIQYAYVVQAQNVHFEACDNYQKQSYRNRTKIATSTGPLRLTIPVLHSHDASIRQAYFGVEIENKFHWQRDHWRSLKAAYQTSPYFEYYEDTFEPLYTNTYSKLIDFILDLQQIILECLQLELTTSYTEEYIRTPKDAKDLRHLISPKKEPNYPLPAYHQLFNSNHGYLPNLSVLDLIFNEGPNALTYLEAINLTTI